MVRGPRWRARHRACGRLQVLDPIVALHHVDGVGLAQAEAHGARAVERRDGRDARDSADGDGEEARVDRTDLVLEPHLEDHVLGLAVLVIVHVEGVEDAVVEREVGRAVGGLEQGIDREDHGHLVWVVVAHERVPVGDVGGSVEGGDRGLAVVRGLGAVRQREGREQRQRPRDFGRGAYSVSRFVGKRVRDIANGWAVFFPVPARCTGAERASDLAEVAAKRLNRRRRGGAYLRRSLRRLRHQLVQLRRHHDEDRALLRGPLVVDGPGIGSAVVARTHRDALDAEVALQDVEFLEIDVAVGR